MQYGHIDFSYTHLIPARESLRLLTVLVAPVPHPPLPSSSSLSLSSSCTAATSINGTAFLFLLIALPALASIRFLNSVSKICPALDQLVFMNLLMKHIVPLQSLLSLWISFVAWVCVFSLDHFIARNSLTSLQSIDKLFPQSWIVFQKQQPQRLLIHQNQFTWLHYASRQSLSMSSSLRPKPGKLPSPTFSFWLVTNTVRAIINWYVIIIEMQVLQCMYHIPRMIQFLIATAYPLLSTFTSLFIIGNTIFVHTVMKFSESYFMKFLAWINTFFINSSLPICKNCIFLLSFLRMKQFASFASHLLLPIIPCNPGSRFMYANEGIPVENMLQFNAQAM